MIRPWWSKAKDIENWMSHVPKVKCCRNMILLGRQCLGNPVWYMLVQRAYSAATHTTTANAYEQSKRRWENVGRVRCAYFVSFALQGGNRILHWLSCTYFWCSFRFFFGFFRVFSKKTGIWILWNMRNIGFSPERGAKNAYYRIPALYGKKRKKSAQNFSLQYVNLASICWTISRPWGGLERVCWTNANAYHHAIAFHGMACQKIILHLTVGAGSGGKRYQMTRKY